MSIDGLKFLIDAGHGGKQSEAEGELNGKTIYEKDLNLMFAESVATTLQDFGAIVYMTRDDDSTVDIDDR